MVPDSATRATGSRRLQTWKEIASYLGVGVRTAQVWERERGLPVRRPPGPRGLVYAEVADLEAWRAAAPEPSSSESRRVWYFAAGAGGLALLTGLVLLRAHVMGPGDVGTTLHVVPLTTDVGVERAPHLSPDGTRVAFVQQAAMAGSQVVIQQVSTGVQRVVATGVLPGCFPRWSPNGALLAVTRAAPNGVALAVLPAAGGQERLITTLAGAERARNPLDTLAVAWTPDGTGIVVPDRDNTRAPFHLAVVNVATGARQPLTTPPAGTAGDTQPIFSPDGARIAFVRQSTFSEADAYVMTATGSMPTRVTMDNARIDGITWLPNSRALVFGSYREVGHMSLWRLGLDHRGDLLRLQSGEGSAHYPSIAATSDGARLVYEFQVRDTNIWRMPLGTPADARGVITSTWLDQNPAVSPDGQRLAFFSRRTGTDELWLAKTDGSQQEQLTTLRGPYSDAPRWSPDSQWIAFTSSNGGNRDIYLLNTSTHTVERFTTEPSEEGRPSWSTDGTMIYFRSNRSGTAQLWKQRRDKTNPAVQVTHNGAYDGVEAPDGTTLYYIKGRDQTGLWRVSTKGGPETLVSPNARENQFALTTTGIIFRSGTAIFNFAFATQKATQVGTIPGTKELTGGGFSATPDATTIFWPQVDQDIADLMTASIH